MYLMRTGSYSPAPLDGYSLAIADKLGNLPFNISKDKNLARLLDRGILSWNLSLVLHQLNKAPLEPIKEAPLKHLTFKMVFLLGEIHAWQNKILDTNPIGQRCPRIHYPAFYPKISWPRGSRQCGPSGYNSPGPTSG